jgi:signal transduction histidine kinase
MTLRRRLTLAFAAILLLFGANIAVYSVGDARRQGSMQDLGRAIEDQALLSSIAQDIHDTQRQVTLLSQISAEEGGAGASPDEVAQFRAKLESIGDRIKRLRVTGSPTLADFARVYGELSESWARFYASFGVNQTQAITELAVRAEPLGQELTQNILPKLQAEEKTRVQEASANFAQTARVTKQITAVIVLVTMIVAVAVAWAVSRRLTRGLAQLKDGFDSIGSGNLEHRIPTVSRDEFAQLGSAMNHMAERLAAARNELTEAHEQERQRGEELKAALERLRQAQDQLIVQERLASLGSLTAGIAHEIKNPLNFVTNFADLSVELVGELKGEMPEEVLKNSGDLLADIDSNLKKISEHGKRADGIVRGMLLHSRGQGGERQKVSINSLVAEYVKLAFHGMRAQDRDFNVAIDEQYDASAPEVDVVPQDLSRVILNITNNACFAAYAARQRTGRPTIRVQTLGVDGKVEIRVRDNGNGIPEPARKKIFDPFYTTKPAGQGTGLGLSISHDIIVRQHHGELMVDSKEGEYAEFIVRLPR